MLRKWLAPEGISVELCRAKHIAKQQLRQYDVVFNMMYYWKPRFRHRRAITQLSSYSYWDKKKDGFVLPSFYRSVICKISEIAARFKAEVHPGQTVGLYHPVDVDLFKPVRTKNARELTFGYVGHRRRIKGLHLIRKAIEATGSEFKSVLFTRKRGSRLCRQEMADFYHSIDCYLCASEPGTDAGPMTAVEAFFCGLPLITTRVGQVQEMVEDGENGILVDRNVDSICRAITTVKNNYVDMKNTAMSNPEKWSHRTKNPWLRFFRSLG